jgi:hypothetical protein
MPDEQSTTQHRMLCRPAGSSYRMYHCLTQPISLPV